MDIKKLLFLSFVLLCVNLCFAQDLGRTFSDSEYGYTIKYPSSGWQAKIHRSGVVLADINSNDNSSGLQIRVINTVKILDNFLPEYKQKFISEMKANIMSEETMFIDGKKAYTMTFESGRSGRSYLLKSYIIPVYQPSNVFVFQAGVPWEKRFDIVPVLDAIAASFEIRG
jgi:hypothetical protein